MAMAYARVTNQIAACFGCPGPGIANLVPGILEAYSGCTPMLVLGVRSPRQTYGKGSFQETDHIAMLSSITKWATTVELPENIPWAMRRAVQIATSGQPGPVYVELPGDIGLGVWEIPAYTRAVPAPRPAADPAALAAAVDLIAAAKRPLLITGGGTILSGAGSAVGDLCERFGIPIQTTPAGRGSVAETHPLFCGLTGLYRTTFPRRVYESADLLITVGSRMEEFQGGFLPFPDRREADPGRYRPVRAGSQLGTGCGDPGRRPAGDRRAGAGAASRAASPRTRSTSPRSPPGGGRRSPRRPRTRKAPWTRVTCR